jgi:hypothetical protein
MPVVISCPACQRKARVPRKAIGKTIKCPSCGIMFLASRDDLPPSPRYEPETEEAPEPSAEPATTEEDARRVERFGVRLLTLSQALLAVSLALQLVAALLDLIAVDAGSAGEFLTACSRTGTILSVLLGVFATVAVLVGALCCTLPPAALPDRALAGSILILTIAVMLAGMGPLRGSVAGALALIPVGYESSRQAALALFARLHARRLGDDLAAGLAVILAVAYPTIVLGLTLLTVFVGVFVPKPHATFDHVLSVVKLLAETILVAWGGFLLWRVWTRLRP